MYGHRCGRSPRTSVTERQRLPPKKERLRALPRNQQERAHAAVHNDHDPVLSNYLRDAENVLAQGHDAELPSDEDAHELAARMIGERTAYPCAEVWDQLRERQTTGS